MNLGDKIKKRRKELNMSVDELAKRLGKNRATIYRYEKGEIENLPSDVLEQMAKALKTTPQYLIGWKPKKIEDRPQSDNGNWTMGDILRSLRENRNITLEEYSSELNIPIEDLRKYEDGNKQPTVNIINSLMNYMDVDRFILAERFLLAPDSQSNKVTDSYISLVKDWYREFGNYNFKKEEIEQLFQLCRFLKWQRETTKEVEK